MSRAPDPRVVTEAITPKGLRIRGLRKVFGEKVVVADFDLDVRPGELVSLLGPSGCGKTTTLRMVAGFLAADAGRIEIDGSDVVRLPPDRRPSAMVFQNYALWPHMSVFKNVAYPLKLRRLPKAEIERRVLGVLELVDLAHHRDSRPATISGGEQQRAALARALVQEPHVLLLDEPLSNLDSKLRVKVREDIRELQQRLGITTVLVTHDQDEALSMSDRVAVMNDGRIEQFSAPDELYDAPRTSFVANFVGQLNTLPGVVTGGRVAPRDGILTCVRPEHTTCVAPGSGDLDGIVRRVVPRGAFQEVVIDLDSSGDEPTGGSTTVRSMAVRPDVSPGQRVGLRLERPMSFRDGARVDSPAPTHTPGR
ncbi:ABC transporter ATP-binding protein [Agilicoccus flavus]|uniref:ABC transporter ATP-binding protein n=1 Tax=Agilicoccus flavus TaxID=2775968 RepID=UPI001CF6345E|nr:ABC transporter ATP-binding protein [Agilicoccus flavus]